MRLIVTYATLARAQRHARVGMATLLARSH